MTLDAHFTNSQQPPQLSQQTWIDPSISQLPDNPNIPPLPPHINWANNDPNEQDLGPLPTLPPLPPHGQSPFAHTLLCMNF